MSNEPQKARPVEDPARVTAAPNAQKVRSSRYEWEGKSNESGAAVSASAGRSNVSRRSLVSSLRALLKRLFFGNREAEDRFFDNDDDASPSAA